jgi:hypothetical protein
VVDWKTSVLTANSNFANLAKVHYTFANTPVDFRQLANVHWTLANTSCGLSPLANVRLLSVGEIREPRFDYQIS